MTTEPEAAAMTLDEALEIMDIHITYLIDGVADEEPYDDEDQSLEQEKLIIKACQLIYRIAKDTKKQVQIQREAFYARIDKEGHYQDKQEVKTATTNIELMG
jgi:hypothetical protein